MNHPNHQYDGMNQPFFIARQKKGIPFNMPMCHYHNAYEIYYLLEGRRNYFIKNRTYPVMKGDIVLINACEIHKTTEMEEAAHERILINFQKDFIHAILEKERDIGLLDCFTGEHKVIRLSIPEQAFVQSILIKMADENKKKHKGYLTYERILLVELLLFIHRHIEETDQEKVDYNSRLHKKMSEVAGYLMENYQHKLSLTKVADRFYITPCHLSRAFKKTTGFTFVEYLNHIRVKEAQKLLKETRKSVMQISELTGFDSQTHFGRVFKSMTGLSPLKYRKQPGI